MENGKSSNSSNGSCLTNGNIFVFQMIEDMKNSSSGTPAQRIREEELKYESTVLNFTQNNVILHVYFKTLEMVMYQRREIYSVVDLLGNSS